MVLLSVKLLSHDRPYTIILVLVLMMSSKNSSTITKFLVREAVKKLFETLLYRRREATIYYFLDKLFWLRSFWENVEESEG